MPTGSVDCRHRILTRNGSIALAERFASPRSPRRRFRGERLPSRCLYSLTPDDEFQAREAQGQGTGKEAP